MISILSSRLAFTVLCLLFKCSLDLAYYLFISPVFLYDGFVFSFNPYYYFFTLLLYLFCLFLTPHLVYKVSDYFLGSFLLTVIAPLSSIVGLINAGLLPFIVTVSVFLFFRSFQHGRFLSTFMPIPRVPVLVEGRTISLFIALIAILALTLWYYYSGAVRYFNLNFMKVYDFRELSGELTSVGFFAYFDNWVFGVLSIFLMCYCLYKGRFVSFSVLMIFQIFFYGVSNHKSVLFYPLMIFFMWLYFSRTRAISVMPLVFFFIIGSCLCLYLILGHTIAGSLFIRRVFFVPAKLTLDYFSFFSLNELVWWSNSIFSSFVEYPYSLTLSRMIGEYNGSGSSANNGFIASGYAHGGLIGVAVYTFIFTYFLKFLDRVVINSDIPIWLALCITIVPLRAALISSDLFTTMLTHGLAVSFIMVLLFRRSPNSLTKESVIGAKR